jgi:Trypsin-like peptidase domain/Effector-associated domain 1
VTRNWTLDRRNNLIRLLANIYPMQSDSLAFVRRGELPPSMIKFNDSSLVTWTNIITYAVEISSGADRIVDQAILENPGNEALLAARDTEPPPPIEGPQTKWKDYSAGQQQLEKIMGSRSTLISISSLELGLQKARSVVRVKRKDGSSGTGFVTSDNVLITNNHVVPDRKTADEAVIQFNYQKTIEGLDSEIVEHRLDCSFFKASPEEEDDWTAVKISGDASKWGSLPLRDIKIKANDFVNIIQHPGGGHKQMSYAPNVVTFVDENRVQYLTDTLPGSSGSPVFDVDWNVVALHHSGGWLLEPSTSQKKVLYRNEGIAIGRIIEGLKA